MDIKYTVGNLCKEKGMSIASLESCIGLGKGTIARWDSISPKLDNVAKVADYFGVSIDYIAGRQLPDRSSGYERILLEAYNSLSADNRTLIDTLMLRLLKSQKSQ